MLDTKDLIILTAAFYLGSVVSKFFTALSDGIITPILAPAAAAGKGVTEFSVDIAGVKLKIGEVVTALVQLIISFVLVVFTIGYLRTYFLSKIGAGKVAQMM
jgi:large-conductance mechanosensitive channel